MDMGGQLKGHAVLSLKLITFEYFVVSSLRLAALRQKVWGKWGFTKISISSHEPSFIYIPQSIPSVLMF